MVIPAMLMGPRLRGNRHTPLAQALSEALVSIAGLVGRPVRAQDGTVVGRITDVVVRAEGVHPRVAGFHVRIGRRSCWLHAEDVAGVEQGQIELAQSRFDLVDVQRRPGEIMLVADVIDHQLVDVAGLRVVRASDLYLAKVSGEWQLVGVDVSWGSFLRRALPGSASRTPTPGQVLDWAGVHSLAVSEGSFRLNRTQEGLRLLNPGELAELLDDLGRSERLELLAHLDLESAADTLEVLDDEDAVALLRDGTPERAAAILSHMELDEAVDALRDLEPDERERILASMEPASLGRLRSLLTYDENTAAGIMTSDLITVGVNATVDAAVTELKAARDRPDQVAIVVVVDEGRAVAELSAAQLLGVPLDQPLSQLVTSALITIAAQASMGEVIEAIADHRGSGLLVVDDAGMPIGRILADDVVDVLAREHERRWPWQSEIGA
jgi:CBS domain-containing protein/sporulation protein YlmC with PRC-barrel domain